MTKEPLSEKSGESPETGHCPLAPSSATNSGLSACHAPAGAPGLPYGAAGLKRRRRRTWRGWAGAAIAGVGLVLLATLVLLNIRPGWYRPLNPTSKAVLNHAQEAQMSVFRLRNEALNPRLRRITWRITQNQVNSLLAVVYQGADGVSPRRHPASLVRPFVRFTNGRITLAVLDRQWIAGAVIAVGIDVHTWTGKKNPMAKIRIDDLHVGLLPLPRSLLIDRLENMLPHLGPPLGRIIAVYAGSGYARVMTPQILARLAALLKGKPFPLELRINHRNIVVRKILLRAAHVNSRGKRVPAALTVEFTPP